MNHDGNMYTILKLFLILNTPFPLIYTIGSVVLAYISLPEDEKKEKTEKQHHFAVLICARNEANVIGSLLDSLEKQNYQKELIDVYVLINNCSDDTEKIASGHGVHILNCPASVNSKGKALEYAFETLSDQDQIDVYAVFDADNIADPDFFSEMNKALCNGEQIIQGKRSGPQKDHSFISSSYLIYYAMHNAFFNRPNCERGVSASINGSGWCVLKSFIDDVSFECRTIIEDYEYSILCALKNKKIAYCETAISYDDFTDDLKTSLIQRTRWSYGILQCLKRYEGTLIRQAFKGSVSCLLFAYTGMMTFAVLCLVIAVFGNHIFLSDLISYPLYLSFSLFLFWMTGVVLSVIALIMNHDSLAQNIRGILFYAFFMLSWAPVLVSCFFRRNYEWQPIEHYHS